MNIMKWKKQWKKRSSGLVIFFKIYFAYFVLYEKNLNFFLLLTFRKGSLYRTKKKTRKIHKQK